MSKGRLAYHALAFAVTAIWGVTFVCTKVLINAGLMPAQIFALRFSVAYAGIWILCASRHESTALWSKCLKDELLFAFLGITGGSLYFLTENSALSYTQACSVAFLVCIAPLLTLLLTLAYKKLFRGRLAEGLENVRIGWPLISGTVLALSGMAAVLFDGNAVEFSLKGDLLAIGAAFCWALYSLFMSQLSDEYGAFFATRKVFFYGLLTIIPFLIGNMPDMTVLKSPKVWGDLLFLSIVASLVCFVVWNKVMSRLGNVTSTNYVYLNPFFTLIGAVIFLGESLTLQSALGSIAIVIGVALSARASYPSDNKTAL